MLILILHTEPLLTPQADRTLSLFLFNYSFWSFRTCNCFSLYFYYIVLLF